MKIRLIVLLLLFQNIINIEAQELKDVFIEKDYTIDFIGIDFSACKLVGTSSDFKNAEIIKNDYFPKWNNFFYSEPEKYDVAKYLKKENVVYLIESVETINNSTDEDELVTNTTPQSFSEEKLQDMVTAYDINSQSEVSMVFIVNALNKFRKNAVVNLVYFNSKTKKIIYSKELIGIPRGFGLRNYWMGAFYNILNNIKKVEYKIWKKEYK
ncbi:hypothetical protein [Winogradskyella wichelsiae]|uniref:hypothetical protein n=1 Tax=Winogradskyella wichelsiae TaxID=2697007 RepID=UPI0015C6B4AC|nr:hypothetical protein [Winogradskyella wichelsiae]